MSEYGKGGHEKGGHKALPWIQGQTVANLAGRLQSNRPRGVLSAEHGLSSHGGGSPCHVCSFTSPVTLDTSPTSVLASLSMDQHEGGDIMRFRIFITTLGLVTMATACVILSPPLTTGPAASSSAQMHNQEGIKHYQMGHWAVAKKHFGEAIDAEPPLAEPHYNLALALHQLGAHDEATAHFKKAAELAPHNPAITQSRVYQHHVAPRRSYGGGYY